MRPSYPEGKDSQIMGRIPRPDEHRTGLQRRLSAEVRAGMEKHGCSQADLSRLTGIGEPHISLLLRGLRQGTIAAWDRLLNAAHGRADTAVRVPKKGPMVFVDQVEKITAPPGSRYIELRPGGGGSAGDGVTYGSAGDGVTYGGAGGGSAAPERPNVVRVPFNPLNPRRPT